MPSFLLLDLGLKKVVRVLIAGICPSHSNVEKLRLERFPALR